MGDFIVISVIGALVSFIIYRSVKRRKNGQGGCSGCACSSGCSIAKGNCDK